MYVSTCIPLHMYKHTNSAHPNTRQQYIYTLTYIHIHIHTYIHTYIHTHVRMFYTPKHQATIHVLAAAKERHPHSQTLQHPPRTNSSLGAVCTQTHLQALPQSLPESFESHESRTHACSRSGGRSAEGGGRDEW